MNLYTVFLILVHCVLIVHTFVFSEHNDAKRIDLTSKTRSLTFNNESVVVLFDYGTHLLIGAKNVVYNVSISDLKYETIKWNASKESRDECLKIWDTPTHCDNNIRVFYRTRSGFVLCGTHAMKPTCAEFEGGVVQKTFSGVGIVPPQKEESTPFVNIGRDVYTATVTDFDGNDPLLLRRRIDQQNLGLRTKQGVAFEEPNFVKIHQNYHDVLLWFTEVPSDTEKSGLKRESRVARVCARDPGGTRPYENQWTSFVKARVECRIEEKGQDTLYFNQLEDIFTSNDQIFGVFRSQLAGLGASAICAFNRGTISRTFNGRFKNSKEICPRAVTQEEQADVLLKPLIDKSISNAPLFVHNGKDRFTAVAVERNVSNLAGQKFEIMWIGTDLGNVFKIVRNENGKTPALHIGTMQIGNTSISKLSIFKQPQVNGNEQWSLVAMTDSSVHRSPASVCHTARSCQECTTLGDPLCAWATHQCVAVPENRDRVAYIHQRRNQCVDAEEESTVAVTTTTTQRPHTTYVVRYPHVTNGNGILYNGIEDRGPAKMVKKTRTTPECLCERQEPKPCTTEVIQNEVPARAGYLPYVFFFIFGCCVGGAINFMVTWWMRASQREKKPPTPFFGQPIEAFAHTPTSQSMHSQSTNTSQYTDRSTATLTTRGPTSKQTYC